MCEVEEEHMPSVPRTPPYQQGNNHCSDDPYLDQHKLAYGVVYIYSYNFFSKLTNNVDCGTNFRKSKLLVH
jgi:hypothetical protein